MRYLKWLMARLAVPRAGFAVVALALVLALPSLAVPLVADEHLQMTTWRADHAGSGRSFLDDCFVFASGDPAANRQAMEHGHGAWWTPSDFKVAFWRPLSAATFAIDLSLWPGNAVLMHVHTLVWFLALLVALDALYRRFLTPPIATLALALYAWDDARGGVLTWISNRTAIIAGFFGVCVLIAHDRWRRDGWRAGAWLAPVLFALGLLSAEMAIATAAFLLGHALWMDKGPLARRLARLAPYVLIVVAWQAIYSARGFGVTASGSYVHPLHEPLSYAAKLAVRAPMLLLGQLTPFMADLWLFSPTAMRVGFFVIAVATIGVVARIAWPRLAAEPQSRFWLAGALLSLLPISAAGPGDRNLVFVGFGASAALAMAFARLADDPPASKWPRFVVGALVVFNLALAPLLLPLKCLGNFNMETMRAQTDANIPRDATVAQKTLVVVSASSEGGVFFAWSYRDAMGIPKPGRTRILATSFGPVSVTRLDAVTLRVRPDGGFLAGEMHQLMRNPSRRFRVGDVVTLSNMTATVEEIAGDGRPTHVTFRFAAPLESPEFIWMRGQGMGLVGWTPPRVGETVVVPGAL